MPTAYPVSTIAKLFGISERRVQQLAQDGIIPKPEKNQYELVGSVRAYINYLQQRAFGKGVAPQDTHLERARLLKAQADMAEIELAQRTGELVTVERVEADWLAMVAACRAKLLGIPTKSAYQISNLKDTHEIEKFLKRTIHEALTELATYEPDDEDISADDEDSDGGMDATAGTDSEPVGGSASPPKPRGKQRTRKMGD
jgi:phage terminase Nu1 subunit (DNA packaging protein)